MRSDTTLQEALETVGQSETMDALIHVSKQVELYNSLRSEEQSGKKARTLELRMNAYSALQVFISAVQQAIALKKGDREKHQEYLEEIEGIMVYTSGQVSSRDTRRKNMEEATKTDTTPAKKTQPTNTQIKDNVKSVMTEGERESTDYSLDRMIVQQNKPQQDKAHKDNTRQGAAHKNVTFSAMKHHVPSATVERPIESGLNKEKIRSSDFTVDEVPQNGANQLMVDS